MNLNWIMDLIIKKYSLISLYKLLIDLIMNYLFYLMIKLIFNENYIKLK